PLTQIASSVRSRSIAHAPRRLHRVSPMDNLGAPPRFAALWLGIGIAIALAAVAPATPASQSPAARRRGIPENAPWTSFYGTARQMGDLRRVAATFRLINIDADPAAGNFTRADIATLRAGGRNTVLSYLNVGACERYRSYWTTAPPGMIPCSANKAGQIGA